MSDENAGESSGQTPPPPGGQYPPNWGNAYPPPPQYPPPGAQYPPGPPPGGYPPPGYGYGFAPQAPKHPQSVTAMVLGIVGVAGGLMCYLPLFAAPFGWYFGRKAMKEIDASGGAYSGRSEAKAGFILGIIGTVILILALALLVLVIVLSFTVDDFWDDDYDTYDAVFKMGVGALHVALGR